MNRKETVAYFRGMRDASGFPQPDRAIEAVGAYDPCCGCDYRDEGKDYERCKDCRNYKWKNW